MRNVVVTGGSRGIGLGIVRRVAEAGFHAIAIARKESDELKSAIEEIETGKGSIDFVPFDLADIDGIGDLVKRLRKDFGPVYGLVNNAGISAEGSLALMRSSQMEQVVRLNTLSPMVMTKYVVRSMMADGGGRIVNMSSITASTGYSGLSVYSATKGALLGFTRSLAREVGRMGVTVNAVAPGFVDTDMTHALKDEHREQIVRRSALRRLVDVKDVASAVEFLLSDGARNMTGTVLTVDAGEYGLSTLEIMGAANRVVSPGISPAKAWLRALELTAPIAREPDRIFPAVIDELAAQRGDAPALLSDRGSLTYQQLAARSNQYARWALDQNLAKGEVVGLLMHNQPDYLAAWLGITRVGGVVALLNTSLTGASLAHCINVVSPRHLIVAAQLAEPCTTALPHLSNPCMVWMHGEPCRDGYEFGPRIDIELEPKSGASLSKNEGRSINIEDRALYIYTSGTTGLPKAANISHGRVMQWSHWFAGMAGSQATDRLYNCLPMYHSVGGVLAPGAILASGGALVIQERFSAKGFWNDVIRWDCTMFQYIGELCRYLLHAAPSANENGHRIRMACGNGLAPEVWDRFKDRFCIPQILEFYGATEGAISLFNVQGKRGAIGHVPAYLAHRFSPALVAFDLDKGEPVRNAEGRCIRCAANEPGEALSKLVNDSSNIGGRFEGYTDQQASERKILRDVFERGDAWVRTGDLMRKDEHGYYYFVDRVGDTFRWKGENVATSDVQQAICSYPGVKYANVYGVEVRGADGRAGMAALATGDQLDLAGLRTHLVGCLPAYARPLFLRLGTDMNLTGTFKYAKVELVRQGFDPAASGDAIYFDDSTSGAFTRLDVATYQRIQSGDIRF